MVRASPPPHGSVTDCDLLIIGSGPAGITVASAMAGTACRVVLLESGGPRETPEKRDLLRGYVWPQGSHEPLENNRRRQFGGTSTAWGGRCIPFDQVTCGGQQCPSIRTRCFQGNFAEHRHQETAL